ncbi:SNF2-related protein [Bradyrhizobium sp. 191]|uniref:DEAD/DEAH box helicase n=1 Tax=Bradyrhizobium sp. 191 TaxID=2782659 RepID=UPI0020978E49|nr:SNF2-related protein [Bradyrhizobium sp. 191]
MGLPPRLAFQFLSAPAIPRAQVEEVSRRLSQRLPELHHGLLPAQPTVAVTIEEDPRPVLRLRRSHLAGYYYHARGGAQQRGPAAVASLGFRYGGFDIDPTQRASRVELFQAGKLFAITRRQGKEKQARKRLADVGLRDARAVLPTLDYRHAADFTLSDQGDWFDFLAQHAGQLRSEGYEILVDDDFPYRLADSSGDFDAALESSGIDWFELELGIDIDGERQDLAPHVAALVSAPGFTPDRLRQLADKGERFYLPLADGRQLALAADRFLPLVLALHGLHLSGSLDGSKKIRLSQAEIVPLLGVENERFVFRGADNLRRLANLLQLRGLAAPDLPPTFRATLRPYQAQGVAWLDLLRESGLGGVLADDMGLGKTIQVLALIALEKQRGRLTKPVLVVAPTSLMTNWSAEKFAPDLKVLVLQGPTRKEKFPAIAEHDLVLTTYPLIARDREVLLTREWHVAVLDEAQTVKNPDAATTRWLREVKAAHRFCLTGTPMENHLGELWSIMSFVMPGYLGDKPRSRANGAP